MLNFLKKIFGSKSSVSLAELIAGGALILDVRTEGEFKHGHLKKSINIPLDRLENRLAKLDKNKAIITVCASGMRSSSAKRILLSNGFIQVQNGGSWTSLKKYGVS